MSLAALLLALALPHGGQYLPPPPDPDAPVGVPFTQPGSGPVLPFEAGRWEWWFDFNEDPIVRLRERLRRGVGPAAAAWEPVTDEDRDRVLLPRLVEALRSSQRDVRAAAVLGLARLAVPGALPYIEAATEDGDLFVRTQAILALGVSGQGAAAEPLARLLADADLSAEERTFAAAGLGLLQTGPATAALLERLAPMRLARQRPQLRAALVAAAGLTGSAEAVAALATLVESQLGRASADLRGLAGVALGQLGRQEGLPTALHLLRENDNQVRRSTASGLAGLARWLTAEQVRAVIEHYERESDLPTRARLLLALGEARQPTSREFLVETLERAPALLRPTAALALGLDGDPRLVAPLAAVLADQHEVSVRASLLLAIGLLGAPEGRSVLEAQVERARDPLLQSYLALALGLQGLADDQTVQALERWAQESHDVEVVRHATEALALLGRREAVAALAKTTLEVRGTVDRASRLHALGRVGDRSLLAPLVAAAVAEAQPTYVRTYAVAALGAVGDPRDLPSLARLSTWADLDHQVGFVFELYQLH